MNKPPIPITVEEMIKKLATMPPYASVRCYDKTNGVYCPIIDVVDGSNDTWHNTVYVVRDDGGDCGGVY